MLNKIIKRITVFLLAVFLVASCTSIYEDGGELASVTKKYIKEMSVDSLQAIIDRGEAYLLLDVRQPAEYDKGNIPGSFNIPRGELEFLIVNDDYWEEQFMYTPLKDDRIIIYCKSGARGALAAESLQRLGFNNVYNLTGGWLAFSGGEVIEQPVSSGGCGD